MCHTEIVGIIYYCTRIGVSVLRTGRGRAGGGGGGEVEFLTEKKISDFFPLLNFFFQKCSWGSETHANKNLFFRGGGDFGVFGAPHAPTRGSRGVGKGYTSSYGHGHVTG